MTMEQKKHASRPGVQTSEFRGKLVVQVSLLATIVLQRLGFDVEIDEQVAWIAIGVLETVYIGARAYLKRGALS